MNHTGRQRIHQKAILWPPPPRLMTDVSTLQANLCHSHPLWKNSFTIQHGKHLMPPPSPGTQLSTRCLPDHTGHRQWGTRGLCMFDASPCRERYRRRDRQATELKEDTLVLWGVRDVRSSQYKMHLAVVSAKDSARLSDSMWHVKRLRCFVFVTALRSERRFLW